MWVSTGPTWKGCLKSCTKKRRNCSRVWKNFRRRVRGRRAAGLAGLGRTAVPEDLRQHLEEEVGDLFFVLVNIARYLSLDPESALRKTNRKFKRRFQWMEEQLRDSGRDPEQASWTNWNRYGNRPRPAEENEQDSEREAG